MIFIYLLLCLSVFFVTAGIFANYLRQPDKVFFELKQNCLMTRWPVVFVTGHRSLFYFRRYWNIYPIFLAEHGFEVFTLHLPWRNREQRKKFLMAALKQTPQKNFHFFMDEATAIELEELLKNSPQILSQTVLSQSQQSLPDQPLSAKNRIYLSLQQNGKSSWLIKAAFKIHQLIISKEKATSLDTLGAHQNTNLENCHRLLLRLQDLAEHDFSSDHLQR